MVETAIQVGCHPKMAFPKAQARAEVASASPFCWALRCSLRHKYERLEHRHRGRRAKSYNCFASVGRAECCARRYLSAPEASICDMNCIVNLGGHFEGGRRFSESSTKLRNYRSRGPSDRLQKSGEDDVHRREQFCTQYGNAIVVTCRRRLIRP